MNPRDRYIDEVMRSAFASAEDRARLEADLRAHFAEAEARGEPPGRIIDGLGTPAEVAAAFNAEREIRYAGFGQRLVAFVADFALLVTLAVPLLALALLLESGRLASGDLSIGWGVLLTLAIVAVSGIVIFYFPLLEARFGKTLGKHLLRIRVLRENAAPIGLGQAFVRRLSFYFELLMLDSLLIFFTDRRQRALDIVARTIVAREPGDPAPTQAWAVCLLLPVVPALALIGLVALCAP